MSILDRTAKKLTEKMGKGVKEAAAPIKTEVAKAANNKVDLWSKVLRLGVLVFLFVDGTRRVVSETKSETQSSPNQIVINNYLYRENGTDK